MVSSNLLVLLLALVSGQHVFDTSNETLTDAGIAVHVNETQSHGETNDSYHNNIIHPQVSINLSLLDMKLTMDLELDKTTIKPETPHNLPLNPSDNITLQTNKTLFDSTLEANVTYEDDESFQDQEKYYTHWDCDTVLLDSYGHQICGQQFHAQMSAITQEGWCDMKEVIQPYNSLSLCLEELSEFLHCYYPNSQIQAFFLGIHETYFRSCLGDEGVPRDAPQGLVLALTLFPVSLIPVLVFMAVRKKNANE